MSDIQRYSYTTTDSILGEAGLMPFLPLTLMLENRSTTASGLLDTGSSINVLPYQIGLQLGASWEEQPLLTQLGGNLAQLEARGLIVSAQLDGFDLVRLVFAWTRSDDVPLILGQVNFFMEFDVCFHRSRLEFEVKPKY